MRLFGELTKIEDQPDGTLKVYGVASTGARDDAGEIVLPAAMKAALPDYARYPALREMHQPTAAGRTLEASVDGDGATRIVAHVVDPVAIAKVRSRTYSGFSIGGRVLARDPGDASVITKIKLSEISLVDRPANPEAVIDLWKADAAEPAAAPPSNEAVKALAAELAASAGRPRAWKDYVAKARAALTSASEASGLVDDEAPDGADDASDNLDAPDAAMDAAPDADEPDDSADADDGLSPADLIARLAELAAADPDALQAAHDALAALGVACDPDNCPDNQSGDQSGDQADDQPAADPDDDLSRLAGAALADLAKALPRVEALERRLETHGALLERLAATPLPPRTAASPHAQAIGKAEDADPSAAASDLSAADAQAAFAALTPDERAFLLMKASLRRPIPLP
ncbi:MAG TPA: HK97 family phage prohead protease [Caulobacteraceae bacterium]|nr:HK97 family phage prohead protease [Caulobacteraceae bacterium]